MSSAPLYPSYGLTSPLAPTFLTFIVVCSVSSFFSSFWAFVGLLISNLHISIHPHPFRHILYSYHIGFSIGTNPVSFSKNWFHFFLTRIFSFLHQAHICSLSFMHHLRNFSYPFHTPYKVFSSSFFGIYRGRWFFNRVALFVFFLMAMSSYTCTCKVLAACDSIYVFSSWFLSY